MTDTQQETVYMGTENPEFHAAFLAAQKAVQASFKREKKGAHGHYVPSDEVIPKVRECLNQNGLSLTFGQGEAIPVRYPSKPDDKNKMTTDGGGDTAIVFCWAKAFNDKGSVSVGMWQDIFGSYGNTVMSRHMSGNATPTFANRKLAMMLMGATDGDKDIQALYDAIHGDNASQAAADARSDYANGATAGASASLKHDNSAREGYPYQDKRIDNGHALMTEFLEMGCGTAEEKALARDYVESYGQTRGNQAPSEETMKRVVAVVKKYGLKVKGE